MRPFRIESEGVHDVVAPHGVSAPSHPLATAAGAEMLLRAGNAVDASPA